MKQNTANKVKKPTGHVMPDKAVKTIASSIFKNLTNEGCNPKDIIGVSSQLLSLVTSELQKLDKNN